MSTDLDLADAEWFASSHSQGDGGQCVEFSPSRLRSGIVPVRDSKAVPGPALRFPTGAWSSFVVALRGGGLSG